MDLTAGCCWEGWGGTECTVMGQIHFSSACPSPHSPLFIFPYPVIPAASLQRSSSLFLTHDFEQAGCFVQVYFRRSCYERTKKKKKKLKTETDRRKGKHSPVA